MKTPLITAWSASRVTTFELCPAKVYFERTTPRVEPLPGDPRELGLRVHKEGEDYLRGKVRKVPTWYRYFAKDLQALRKAKAEAEVQLAFREDWSLTGWFAQEVRCRMALDATVVKKTVARVVDFKTGRMYEKDEGQCELYAVGLFHRYPKITKVTAELWYLKTGDAIELTIPRAEAPAIQKGWEQRAQRLLDAKEFPPKPGPPGKFPCAWCDFSKTKGGPCKVG